MDNIRHMRLLHKLQNGWLWWNVLLACCVLDYNILRQTNWRVYLQNATPVYMKKEISLGQLIGTAVTLLLAVSAGWLSLNNKVITTENNLKGLEIRFVDMQIANDKKIDRLEEKIDRLSGTLNDVKVLLERKADRP